MGGRNRLLTLKFLFTRITNLSMFRAGGSVGIVGYFRYKIKKELGINTSWEKDLEFAVRMTEGLIDYVEGISAGGLKKKMTNGWFCR